VETAGKGNLQTKTYKQELQIQKLARSKSKAITVTGR
jgi:hypothetical protein